MSEQVDFCAIVEKVTLAADKQVMQLKLVKGDIAQIARLTGKSVMVVCDTGQEAIDFGERESEEPLQTGAEVVDMPMPFLLEG